jgi:poly(beta-D-mannuronate) lyase
MKKIIVLVSVILFMYSCNEKTQERHYVKDIKQLNIAIENATPGDEIILANGVWENVQINFYGVGEENKPITLRAETVGKVFIEGQSFLHLGGKHLIVDGFYFRNGYSPKSNIISYKIGKDSTAFHSKVTNCVIENFTKPNRLTNDHWIDFYGQHNEFSYCYVSGKSNDGETLRVYHTGNEHTSNYHQIIHNYFGPRPRKGGPRAETIRVGDSKTSMSSGFVNVSNNYFEACNGEVEIISDKTNFNDFSNNIFYKCEGSLVLRHGSFTKVNGNIFIGGDESNFYGGIRVVSSGHWITNNYFYKINGEQFRSPLAIMNGIPMSPINRYKQVTDVVIAHNTWVDCKSPWQIGVGQNIASADVLPKYEIRSAPPIRSIIANNLIYNTSPDNKVIVNHDTSEGILFSNNIIDNAGLENTDMSVIQSSSIKSKQLNAWLYAPENIQNNLLESVYSGFNFDKIELGLFGTPRAMKNLVGAINDLSTAERFVIDKKKYGPQWFSSVKEVVKPKILTATSVPGELNEKISIANDGDIIELCDSLYTISKSLKIDKAITIRSKKNNQKAQLIFIGKQGSVAFKMHPHGSLVLENISIQSKNSQIAFAPLKENMASAYNLFVNNCLVQDFAFVLKAYKASFADTVEFTNTSIENCENGFLLAAEEKGDYNAEMLIFKNCKFNNVRSNVINFYRGGYDESTIGGSLLISNSSIINCGTKEKSGILLKTVGIINVNFKSNTFENNPIKHIAILWGEKNNHHSNNSLKNSGKITVEQQQKQEILY